MGTLIWNAISDKVNTSLTKLSSAFVSHTSDVQTLVKSIRDVMTSLVDIRQALTRCIVPIHYRLSGGANLRRSCSHVNPTSSGTISSLVFPAAGDRRLAKSLATDRRRCGCPPSKTNIPFQTSVFIELYCIVRFKIVWPQNISLQKLKILNLLW